MSRPRPDFRRDFPQIESVFGYMIHRSDLNHNICIHALGYKLKCRRSQNIFFRKNIVWRTTIQEPVVHSRENIYWAFWSDRISALNRHYGASTVCSLSEDLLFFFNTISLNAKSSNLPFKLAATMAYFNLSPSTRSSAGIFLKENVCVCVCMHIFKRVCLPLPSDSPNNAEYLMCMRWIGSGSCLLLTIELTSKGARLSLSRQQWRNGLGVAGLFTLNRQPQSCKAVYLPLSCFSSFLVS